MSLKIIFLFIPILANFVTSEFELNIIHLGDIHSNYFETTRDGGECPPEDAKKGKCFGGIDRMVTKIKEIRRLDKNVLVLGVGDFYLSSSYYPFHGWRLAADLMPFLELNATALGNNDLGDSSLDTAAYINKIAIPVVSCNFVGKNESFWRGFLERSVVFEINGTKVGIIGYINKHAKKQTAMARNKNFTDEITCIREEVDSMKKKGVNVIIVLGHGGVSMDRKIAKEVPGVDIIVGGDSDAFMVNNKELEGRTDHEVFGPYPLVEVKFDDSPRTSNASSNSSKGNSMPRVEEISSAKHLLQMGHSTHAGKRRREVVENSTERQADDATDLTPQVAVIHEQIHLPAANNLSSPDHSKHSKIHPTTPFWNSNLSMVNVSKNINHSMERPAHQSGYSNHSMERPAHQSGHSNHSMERPANTSGHLERSVAHTPNTSRHLNQSTEHSSTALKNFTHSTPNLNSNVTQKDGQKTLIVHVPQGGQYIGRLKVIFDDKGRIVNYSGDPVLLDNTVHKNKETATKLADLTKILLSRWPYRHLPHLNERLATADKKLAAGRFGRWCRMKQCDVGDLMTEAILLYFNNHSSPQYPRVNAAIWNSGAIRFSIGKGDITFLNLSRAIYLGGLIKRVNMSGEMLKKMFEKSVASYDRSGVDALGSFLQVAGINVTYNMGEPVGKRVTSLTIRTFNKNHQEIKEVSQKDIYVIAMPHFLKTGGDGLHLNNDSDVGVGDATALVWYVKNIGNVSVSGEPKIKMEDVDRWTCCNDTSNIHTNRTNVSERDEGTDIATTKSPELKVVHPKNSERKYGELSVNPGVYRGRRYLERIHRVLKKDLSLSEKHLKHRFLAPLRRHLLMTTTKYDFWFQHGKLPTPMVVTAKAKVDKQKSRLGNKSTTNDEYVPEMQTDNVSSHFPNSTPSKEHDEVKTMNATLSNHKITEESKSNTKKPEEHIVLSDVEHNTIEINTTSYEINPERDTSGRTTREPNDRALKQDEISNNSQRIDTDNSRRTSMSALDMRFTASEYNAENISHTTEYNTMNLTSDVMAGVSTGKAKNTNTTAAEVFDELTSSHGHPVTDASQTSPESPEGISIEPQSKGKSVNDSEGYLNEVKSLKTTTSNFLYTAHRIPVKNEQISFGRNTKDGGTVENEPTENLKTSTEHHVPPYTVEDSSQYNTQTTEENDSTKTNHVKSGNSTDKSEVKAEEIMGGVNLDSTSYEQFTVSFEDVFDLVATEKLVVPETGTDKLQEMSKDITGGPPSSDRQQNNRDTNNLNITEEPEQVKDIEETKTSTVREVSNLSMPFSPIAAKAIQATENIFKSNASTKIFTGDHMDGKFDRTHGSGPHVNRPNESTNSIRSSEKTSENDPLTVTEPIKSQSGKETTKSADPTVNPKVNSTSESASEKPMLETDIPEKMSSSDAFGPNRGSGTVSSHKPVQNLLHNKEKAQTVANKTLENIFTDNTDFGDKVNHSQGENRGHEMHPNLLMPSLKASSDQKEENREKEIDPITELAKKMVIQNATMGSTNWLNNSENSSSNSFPVEFQQSNTSFLKSTSESVKDFDKKILADPGKVARPKPLEATRNPTEATTLRRLTVVTTGKSEQEVDKPSSTVGGSNSKERSSTLLSTSDTKSEFESKNMRDTLSIDKSDFEGEMKRIQKSSTARPEVISTIRLADSSTVKKEKTYAADRGGSESHEDVKMVKIFHDLVNTEDENHVESSSELIVEKTVSAEAVENRSETPHFLPWYSVMEYIRNRAR